MVVPGCIVKCLTIIGTDYDAMMKQHSSNDSGYPEIISKLLNQEVHIWAQPEHLF